MKTNQQLETEAILSMVESMKMLEQQLADADDETTAKEWKYEDKSTTGN